ncbi:MAG: hypothetical protein H0U12_07205 [Thermoleophilaceae bacterium]|nr:hypothetical protein [Thermoleophilaceae bacterium]
MLDIQQSPGGEPMSDDFARRRDRVQRSLEGRRRKSEGELYEQRKATGLCTRCGVVAASDDSQYCQPHHEYAKQYSRDALKRLRDGRRAKGLCVYCGTKSEQRRCMACRIKQGRVSTRGVKKGVKNATADRTWKDAGGRTRYHGQPSRGRQSNASLDDQDIDYAISALQKAKQGLEVARSPEVQALPKVQREEVKRAALSQADHGTRFIEEVLDRNRPRGKGGK